MISVIFIILAGICNAVMDIIQFKFQGSVFIKFPKLKQWADPKLSWRNKWKDGDPSQGERFFLSSTVFVWITDLWHFAQSFMISFFVLAAIFYNPIFNYIIDFIILKIAFSLSFELFWGHIFLNKNFK